MITRTTYLGYSLLATLTNYTYVKSYIETHSYKILNTYVHEISVWTILYVLIHLRAPHIGGMNGDVQYDLVTLEFDSREQLEYFHSIILRL